MGAGEGGSWAGGQGNRRLELEETSRRPQTTVKVEETFTTTEGNFEVNRQTATDCKMANECDYSGDKMLFAQASKLVEKTYAPHGS